MILDTEVCEPLDRLVANGVIKAYKKRVDSVQITFLDDTVIDIESCCGYHDVPELDVYDRGAVS